MDTLAGIVTPTRRAAAAEHVAEQLTELIRSGNLKTGKALPGEHELAAAFHVGRPVVRDALRGLQSLASWRPARAGAAASPRRTSRGCSTRCISQSG